MALIFLLTPIITALLFFIVRKRSHMHFISLFAASIMLFSGILSLLPFTKNVNSNSQFSYFAFSYLNDIIRIDALSMLMVLIVLFITFCVAIYTVSYIEVEVQNQKINTKRVRVFYILLYSFIFTMLMTLSTGNIGILWVSLEATTIASAFLVGFSGAKTALEASWKYIIICSVGIAISLMGIVFLNLASAHSLPEGLSRLDIPLLMNRAKSLDPSLLKFAFIFVLIGFGTKAGLAPMHTWLPDAYSQAPSPISALMSSSLINCSMYGIMRFVALTNKSLGEALYTGRLLLIAGIFSVLTAAIFILTQKDYKRLLAYSSIEHMGIIAFSLGLFTNLSIFALLFHTITHSITKAIAFLSSGNIYLKYGSTDIKRIKNVTAFLPISGSVFLMALLSLGGLPPFGIFTSEIYVFYSTFNAQNSILGIIMILLVAFVFVGILTSAFSMFKHDPKYDLKTKSINFSIIKPNKIDLIGLAGIIPLIILIVIIIVLGLYMPSFLRNLILHAQNVLNGSYQ